MGASGFYRGDRECGKAGAGLYGDLPFRKADACCFDRCVEDAV